MLVDWAAMPGPSLWPGSSVRVEIYSHIERYSHVMHWY